MKETLFTKFIGIEINELLQFVKDNLLGTVESPFYPEDSNCNFPSLSDINLSRNSLFLLEKKCN